MGKNISHMVSDIPSCVNVLHDTFREVRCNGSNTCSNKRVVVVGEFFLTHFEVFEYVMKYSIERLI